MGDLCYFLTEVALKMVDANVGIICMPKRALKSFKISNNLIFKSIGINGLKRTYYLDFCKADKVKQNVNDFISNFKEEFLRNNF